LFVSDCSHGPCGPSSINPPSVARTVRRPVVQPSASFLLLFDKRSYGALLGRRFECVNEFTKPLGEHFGTKFPIMGDSGRSNVMAKKSSPTLPELSVHQSVNIMKMYCLERFQELVGSMTEARPIFGGESVEVFEAHSPDPFQLRVFHERFGDIAQGGGSGVLRGKPGHARAP